MGELKVRWLGSEPDQATRRAMSAAGFRPAVREAPLETLDLLVIGSPAHVSVAFDALARGVAVRIEAPYALPADTIASLAEHAGDTPLLGGFTWRHSPRLQRVRELLLEVGSGGLALTRFGGAAGSGPELLDALCQLTGEEPVELWSAGEAVAVRLAGGGLAYLEPGLDPTACDVGRFHLVTGQATLESAGAEDAEEALAADWRATAEAVRAGRAVAVDAWVTVARASERLGGGRWRRDEQGNWHAVSPMTMLPLRLPAANALRPIGDRPLRLGIIGFAHGHQPAYAGALLAQPGVVAVGVAGVPGAPDRPPDEGRRWAAQLGVPYHSDYRDLLASGSVDLASVAVPPALNPEVIGACAAASAHVLSEKPLADGMEELAAIGEAVRRAGVELSLCLASALHPAPVERLLARLRAGEVGAVRSLHAHFLQPRSPQFAPSLGEAAAWQARGWRGIGEWRNFGPYLVCLAGAALRRRPVRVNATMTTPWVEAHRRLGVDDLAVVSIEYEDGAYAALSTGRIPTASYPATDYRVAIIGDRGRLEVAHALDATFTVWGPDRDAECPDRGGLVWERYGRRPLDAFAAELVEAIRAGQAPRINLNTCLEITTICEAAERSARTARAVEIGSSETLSTHFSTLPRS